MNVSVGLKDKQSRIEVELRGDFSDNSGKIYSSGRYTLANELTLIPTDPRSCAFVLENVKIGIGFHWEREERQAFRGALRLKKHEPDLLTVINDVSLEDYVTSVISSEMSAACPLELLKAHAVISRSWLRSPKTKDSLGSVRARIEAPEPHEIVRWYGREAHPDFDVCADDHCQRYQGITKAFSPAAAEAVRTTAGEFLRYRGAICDARFSKCCGGLTELYSTAWEDKVVPYLTSVYDYSTTPEPYTSESRICTDQLAYCNTHDIELLAHILPGFDLETRDFYRWTVVYTGDKLAALVRVKLGVNLGQIRDLQPLARGPSGRIYKLKIVGELDYVIVGKELEIRRTLSPSHLFSSAFIVERDSEGNFILRGAGWGHGVGLCQIGAAVMANEGKTYTEILRHYYPGTTVSI